MEAERPTIRPANQNDQNSVAKLFREVLPNADYIERFPKFREVELAFVNWKLDPERGGDMHLFFSDRTDRVLYVADLAHEVVAMGGAIMSEQGAELVRMQVRNSHRGRGIGTELLLACEKWARDAGASKIHLDTWVVNTSAQQFYEKHGFAKNRVITFELAEQFEKLGLDKVDGLSMDDLKSWEMEKHLQ
eukprot:TRINITY_DN64761_c0_g1_i1.p1 TRINITY_DN64761_c0_g1~~TRINITY_DN64761_c0_g1_i1.p1  ORF type:complete len:190 (-),score=30.69 TRINITY_DN64761_c0_g1_i1:412-981(-)